VFTNRFFGKIAQSQDRFKVMKIEKQELKRSYDLEFLPQENTRRIRLMWELLEPQSKLQMQNIDRTIVFF